MKEIVVYETGPRDGWQNVTELIPLEEKKKIIDGLADAGVSHIQVCSFVNPRAIPQMRDAREVAEYCVSRYPNIDLLALVPNLQGARNAYESGIRHISYVVSLSESHNKANINRTRKESLKELEAIISEYPDLHICLDIATAFSCPFEGRAGMRELEEFAAVVSGMGIKEICLCDTIGTADPLQVRSAISSVTEICPETELMVHIHDTRGMGLACTLAAVEMGITKVQSTLGGLGGCPFAPGASGNAATEDLVYMFQNMRYDTGIDFEKLLRVSKYQKSVIQGNYSGHHVMIQMQQKCGRKGDQKCTVR
nr:hydroxymethylglutaryl-CoA lyase [uncultured Mediterraneibacter sp.]